MLLGSFFNTCGGWLEFLYTKIGSLFSFRYGLKVPFSRLNWISKNVTTSRFVLIVMADPYFLNISIIFFLFLSNSGPGICFTIASPWSRYYLTFSLCKTSQSFVKINESTNSQTSDPSKHLIGTSKSSFPNFFNQNLLSLNNKVLWTCIIIDTSVSLISVKVFAKFRASLKSSCEIEG